MAKKRRPSQLTGVSGVHFVAARLSYLGLHAVPTTRNVPGPDVLVSNLSGSTSVSLQVKTTESALRPRGRGHQKKPHHYEWDIGGSSARLNHPKVFFALVDLRGFRELPDIFIVPSAVVFKYFEGATWRRLRYHPLVGQVEPYKNNWDLLSKALDDN